MIIILPFIISVLCFVIHLELQKSCNYFLVREGFSIRAYSLDKLPTKSIIINSREIKLDNAFFRYYTIFVDGNDLYLVDLKKKAGRGDIILQRDDVFFVKNGLNYVVDNKFCCGISKDTDLKSSPTDYPFTTSLKYLPKNYYVLDLKTKIKPGRI